MAFVLSRHYIAKHDFDAPDGTKVKANRTYRVTGFDFSGNNILVDLAFPDTKLVLPKDWDDRFTDTTTIPEPDDDSFKGIARSETSGYFEGQKTRRTCWACALSNALMYKSGKFITEVAIDELTGARSTNTSPNAEEFLSTVYYLYDHYDLSMSCNVFQAWQYKDWPGIIGNLFKRNPVIVSVNSQTHVILLMACTTTQPYWILYYEPTGGSYRKMLLWDLIKSKRLDYAFSIESK